MNCSYCNEDVINGSIIGRMVVHESCIKGLKAKMNGRPFKCPQCKSSGIIYDTTRKVEKWIPISPGEYAPCAYNDCRGCSHCGEKPIQVHPQIPCPTCDGLGYTKVEYEPVIEPKVTGYKKKN